jgi:RNA polymerase sigma-70 factor (ECF subfamily)
MKRRASRAPSPGRLFEIDDQALLQQVLRQDEAAWRELLRRFRGLIFRCIGKTLARFEANLSNEDPDEIYAEVCFNLLRNDMKKLRVYDPRRGSKLGSWIGLIAINTAYDHLRVTARWPRLDRIEGCPDRPDAAPGPLEELLAAERHARLNALAASFSARDQTFMELYFGRGMSPTEVARRMRISVKTVYSKKNKISKRLVAIAQAEQPTLLAA